MLGHEVDGVLLWRVVNLHLATLAFLLVVWQTWRYRVHWNGRERLFILGTALYALACVVSTVEDIAQDLQGDTRIAFFSVANVWIICAMYGRPSRLD